MGLLRKLKKLRPDRVVRKVGKAGTGIGRGVLGTVRHPTLKGFGRLAVTATGVGAVGLLAYDAKRMRDKSRSRKTAYRKITKAALTEAYSVKERIVALEDHTHLTPTQDGLLNLPCGSSGESGAACQGQGSPSVGLYGFGILQGGSGAAPGPSESTEKAPPEQRGAKDQPAGTSKAGVTLLIAVAVLAFLFTRRSYG